MKKKINFLLEKVTGLVPAGGQGRILDLGCGDGKTAEKLLEKGYDVVAFDMDEARFQLKGKVPFFTGSLNEPLPFKNEEFDYVIFMEVIEHIYNPDFVISQISRILKKGGCLIISTPNILNIGSRFRFLFEGSYDFFRETPLDYSKRFPAAIQNMHVLPWRYQELEYLLSRKNISVKKVHTDRIKKILIPPVLLLKPAIFLQNISKERRSRKKYGISFSRINQILMSPELLLGKHLILECVKS